MLPQPSVVRSRYIHVSPLGPPSVHFGSPRDRRTWARFMPCLILLQGEAARWASKSRSCRWRSNSCDRRRVSFCRVPSASASSRALPASRILWSLRRRNSARSKSSCKLRRLIRRLPFHAVLCLLRTPRDSLSLIGLVSRAFSQKLLLGLRIFVKPDGTYDDNCTNDCANDFHCFHSASIVV